MINLIFSSFVTIIVLGYIFYPIFKKNSKKIKEIDWDK